MRTIYENKFKAEVILIGQGEFAIARSPQIISTTLGSCISVCLFDPNEHVGGINHYMLPGPVMNEDESHILFSKAKYGIHSIEMLINELLKAKAKRENLMAKVFGGANMFRNNDNKINNNDNKTNNNDQATNLFSTFTVGLQNIAFAEKYLKSERIPIMAKDVGGEDARKIYFDPATGHVKLFRLNNKKKDDLINKELSYRKKVAEQEEKEKNQEKEKEITFESLADKITLW
ncbi:MAG: chemotaxis protein CheD [Oligoflexia bacterium]|nr:chemotaxis protein CheD [Oligoflexia bacterium]